MYLSMVAYHRSIDRQPIPIYCCQVEIKRKCRDLSKYYFYPDQWPWRIQRVALITDFCAPLHTSATTILIWCNTQPWFVWTQDVSAAGYCVDNAAVWALNTSASKSSIRRFVITEKDPTRAFSWLKAATNAFTFKTLLRHNAKQVSTPW